MQENAEPHPGFSRLQHDGWEDNEVNQPRDGVFFAEYSID
jgi:hypothetical protein